ncbi:NAD(P)-dependent oxidoreductase [Streptomyces sp. DSM 40750]|uniref:NAD(P)-dependent oxidoreductase n=1 Tax=Streptomyces sp. DSM 40750 TaxID=2801030 RepID=UPI00214AD339|nr:NAD(P)H-binding protein [Streptomyces sp. DSM 40750]UUU19428.1 NAD(P)H-binding protein [Streptomyces sp. DSM 40750]UUU27228.1 NAD(P)H-binding protein [Streptomyces sp. DSM 40750]
MKLVVFGANGPTGRLVTQQALAEGHTVTAVTRRPDAFPIEDLRLRVAGADALNPVAVDEVVAGHHRVVSTLGVPYTREPVTVFSRSARNIVAAMSRHGLRRLVCVTSIGVHPELAPQERFFFRKVVGPILMSMGRPLYEDARRMEAIVRATDLDWTIARPSGLFDATTVTDYRIAVEPQRLPGMFTSRADLADVLLREATEDRHVRAGIEVITTQGTPSYASVFLREALRIGK